jgi:hypothetical protein
LDRHKPPLTRRFVVYYLPLGHCTPQGTETEVRIQRLPHPVYHRQRSLVDPSRSLSERARKKTSKTGVFRGVKTVLKPTSLAVSPRVGDTNAPGACPQCGGWQFIVNRCGHCLLDDLDYVRTHSVAGRLFERVLELEFDTEHFSIPWSDVTAEEVRGLQVLKEERA